MRHLSLPPGPVKIVCIAAHPDDIEIGAGATLLALAKRGKVKGHWLTMTGSSERRGEAEAAAQAVTPNFPVKLPRIPRRAAPSALE
jgi:LmbE family N-acetylglucosaminyl deacetylase